MYSQGVTIIEVDDEVRIGVLVQMGVRWILVVVWHVRIHDEVKDKCQTQEEKRGMGKRNHEESVRRPRISSRTDWAAI